MFWLWSRCARGGQGGLIPYPHLSSSKSISNFHGAWQTARKCEITSRDRRCKESSAQQQELQVQLVAGWDGRTQEAQAAINARPRMRLGTDRPRGWPGLKEVACSSARCKVKGVGAQGGNMKAVFGSQQVPGSSRCHSKGNPQHKKGKIHAAEAVRYQNL